jgi:hypothetical protein
MFICIPAVIVVKLGDARQTGAFVTKEGGGDGLFLKYCPKSLLKKVRIY